MKLDRMNIVLAAETAELWDDDYEIRPDYEYSFGVTAPSVVLLHSHHTATRLMVALAVQLTEDGRADDALELARKTCTDSMGRGTVVYWPGVTLTD